MEAYLGAFANLDQNNWARQLPMAKFNYKNAKNANTGHIPFEMLDILNTLQWLEIAKDIIN